MLTDTRTLFAQARDAGAALGAFNVYALDAAQAVLEAADELECPVILQTGATILESYRPFDLPEALTRGALRARTLVACHLDHAKEIGDGIRALRAGYTSLMVDGSDLPFEENVRLTHRFVELGHSVGVPIEGELGGIGGIEDLNDTSQVQNLTDPEAAREFCQRTGVDALAVAVGNLHGRYVGEPRLDFDRLAKISDYAKIPLVLHGCSGLSSADLRRAISLGILKANFNTELREAYYEGVRMALGASSSKASMVELHNQILVRVRSVVREKLQILGWR